MYLQAAKQVAWEDCAGSKLTVGEATREIDAGEAEGMLNCAVTDKMSVAPGKRMAERRILT